jgi:hypothetical protein
LAGVLLIRSRMNLILTIRVLIIWALLVSASSYAIESPGYVLKTESDNVVEVETINLQPDGSKLLISSRIRRYWGTMLPLTAHLCVHVISADGRVLLDQPLRYNLSALTNPRRFIATGRRTTYAVELSSSPGSTITISHHQSVSSCTQDISHRKLQELSPSG